MHVRLPRPGPPRVPSAGSAMALRRLAGLAVAGGAGAAWYTAKLSEERRAIVESTKELTAAPESREGKAAVQRDGARKAMAEAEMDVLVVGGGATGAGVALDAASRGLKVALLEREDFASGTSSKSTKLVHGGVRYLEKAVFQQDVGQLSLVFEALQERKTFLENARHLAHAMTIQLPCYSWADVPMYWAGLKLYDVVAGSQGLRWSQFLFADETTRQMPTIRRVRPNSAATLKGSVEYSDGQFDDARVNVALAVTAAMAGAHVLNYAEVEGLITETVDVAGRKESVCKGVRVLDKVSGRRFEVRAKRVVNAGGPFADGLRKLADKGAKQMVRPSAGTHITLPAYYASSTGTGLLVPKTRDGRVVFLIPWLGAAIAGTTDADSPVTDRPRAAEADVEFILEALKDYLNIDVRREDVRSVWAGLRPLAVDPNVDDSASTSRDHVVSVGAKGIVTVSGGKWTTYRKMAEDVVNAAAGALIVPTGNEAEPLILPSLQTKRGCMTAHLPLVGARDFHPALYASLAQSGVSEPLAHHLARSYGDRARAVLAVAQEKRGKLNAPLVDGYPVLAAEVAYACRHEMCVTPEDFLARRSRLAFLDVEAARKALPKVVEVMGSELRWGSWQRSRAARQCKAYLDTFEAEPPKKATGRRRRG